MLKGLLISNLLLCLVFAGPASAVKMPAPPEKALTAASEELNALAEKLRRQFQGMA